MKVLPNLSSCALILSLAAAPPSLAQPEPADIMSAVVGIHAQVPEGARTSNNLGTERAGNGIVIDNDGLVLTIGYLIMEAASVTLRVGDNEDIPAKVVAYDHETGFGLVRSTRKIDVGPVPFGDSAALTEGDPVLAIARDGPQPVVVAKVVSRRDFYGYWEYLMPDAIFTVPPQPRFGGAALIDRDGRLAGVGSLVVQDPAEDGVHAYGNMFVPIDALKPILGELLASGRSSGPRRPWLGLSTEAMRGHLFVNRVSSDGPAWRAGIIENDIIVDVDGEPVSGLGDFYQKVWALGDAGVEVPITVLRSGSLERLRIQSGDRYSWLKLTPRDRAGSAL
jgi:S1-C subfamily serine protease